MARYRTVSVKKVSLDSLATTRPRQLSPRQLAAMEREEDLRQAMNEAAALPASEAVAVTLREGQKLPTFRAALNRLLKAEPRDINYAFRGGTLYFSKGTIPGGRGRRRSS